MNEKKRVHTKHQTQHRRKPKRRQWPQIVLAVLVMGFCLFVGISSRHLLFENVSGFNPLDFSTYTLVRNNVDSAYTSQMFSSARDEETALDPTAEQGQKTVDNRLKDAFVDINGLATGALGQRELNGVIKLDNGYITAYLDEKQDVSHQVAQTVAFNQYVQEQGKQFVFVMAPHLIDKYNQMLPTGFVDYFNETADDFLQGLQDAGVAVIDLRQIMQDEGFDHYAGFFRTDHHWTPSAASWANDRVMRELQSWGWLNTGGLTITADDFERVYEDVIFYGTAAERTGESFAGQADALYCLLPKQDIPLYTKRYDDEQYSSSVSFELVYRDWQYADYQRVYGPDAYYFYKTSYQMNVRNDAAPADTSLMMVCDSFGVPFQSFTSAYVQTLTTFDGRDHPDLSAPVAESDIVMVLFNPSSLDIRTENETIFNFL